MIEPPITLRAIHDSGTPNLPPTRVVIHATCPNVGFPAASAPGAQHGTALYFQQQSAGGSAHYVCGVDGEEHCVPEDVIAWHAPPNQNSIGIEINAEGGDYPKDYSRAQWLSPQVWPAVQRAAARTRDLCQRYGIPLVRISTADLLAGRHGICGHVDVSQAWHQSTHSDPGPNFPWAEFMQAVTGPATAPPAKDDDMKLIQQTDRGIALVGPGYFRQLTGGEVPAVNALYGPPTVYVNAADFDTAKAACITGVTEGFGKLIGEVHGKVVDSVFGLEGRPGTDSDDLLGQVLSTRAEVRALAASVAALAQTVAALPADTAHALPAMACQGSPRAVLATIGQAASAAAQTAP